MILVICGAGRNIRLKKHINYSKLLIKINNEYLINHILDSVSIKEIRKIVIILGYQAKKIKKAINKKFRKKIIFLENPHYASTGNMYSLILSEKIVKKNNHDVVWMNADNYISSKIFKKFVLSNSKNILCDVGQKNLFLQKDPVKIFIKNNKMMDIGKNIKRKNINGIAVGVYKLKKIEFLKYVFVGNIIFKYFRKAGFVEPLKYFEGKNLNTYISKKFVWTDIDNYSDLKKSKKLILKDIL
jgi:choline kinase